MRPVVIVVAVNGGYHQRQGITKVPLTPLEIAEEAARCREAGAAVIHFHARDEEGITTGDVEVFRETIKLIREKTDILIQTTNAIGASKDKATGEWIRPSDDERLALLQLEPRPDLYGAAIGSTDFYHPDGGQPNDRPFPNNGAWFHKAMRHAHSEGSTVEFEVVHVPALHRIKRFADEGLFDPNADYLWLLHGGGIANCPAEPRYIIETMEEGRRLFPNAKVGVLGTGVHQFPLSAVGLAADCDSVRVGMEDNLFRASGEPAEFNHQIVADMVELAAFFRRRPATTDEAREILCLNRTN